MFNKTKVLSAFGFLIMFATVTAQSRSRDLTNYAENFFLFFLLFVLLLLIVFVYNYRGAAQGERKFKIWKRLKGVLVDSTPVEEEDEIILDHDYDGIKELDNNLPPWWKWLFYVTIAWGAFYMLYYEVFEVGMDQVEEYKEEVRIAEIQKAEYMAGNKVVTLESVERVTDAAALSEGEQVYQKHCAACHGKEGGGLVGPNLTDEYWIHGGGIKNIFKTIRDGVVEKGMISWESQLSGVEMQNVSSYVMSLEGTNPPGAKPPEGEKWTPETTASDSLANNGS